MKRIYLMLLAFFCAMSIGLAQRTISGVISEDGVGPLIGANVLIKGTSVGTITDLDGTFTLDVPNDKNILVISYTGFTTKEVDVTGLSEVTISLSAGQVLDEIVVTALGTTRNSRDVVYANQTVSSEDLLSTPNKNTLEALRGKVAGVKLTTGSGGVGASTRIVLRGESSLTGNNNALIVVDGIPIDNTTSIRGAGGASSGYSDYGNRFNDINPNDIESVTILKGPSATALYGSRGASGVVLITTKRGKKPEVGFNSSYSVEQAYVLFQRQDQFGQGFGLPFSAVPGRDSGENWSWGPAFDGIVRPWTSPVDADGDGDLEYLSRPYSAVPNQLESFFRLGSTLNNSVYLSGSKENFTYYASYSNLAQEGILENTDYTRNTLKLAATAQLNDKLSSDFSVNYSRTNLNNAQEGSRPFEGQNAYANAIQSPVNIPFRELRDYNSPFHNFDGYYGSYTTNPYFILNEYVNESAINNFLGSISLNYDPIENLRISGKVGTNIVTTGIDEAIPSYSYNPHYVWEGDLNTTLRGGRQSTPGEYKRFDNTTRIIDLTITANYTKDLTSNGDVSLNATVGYNGFSRDINRLEGTTVGGLVVSDFFNLSNSVQSPRSSQYIEEYDIRGLFANAAVGYKDFLFLEYSARKDWSSTLPVGNNGFFYQAVGTSFILTDLLELNDNKFMNSAKLRANYGTTGKDTDPYRINSIFVGNPTLQTLANGHDLTFPLNGQSGFTKGDFIGNPNLKPELTTTLELGADLAFFDNKIEVEYTYYDASHSNQLVVVSLPRSSGFGSTLQNVGEISNKGHELAVTLRPITGLVKGLSWDINLAYSRNVNEVVKIAEDQSELTVGSVSTVAIVAQEGLPFGTFKGIVPLLDGNGNPVVDAVGLPRIGTEQEILGSYQPDFSANIGSRIGFKGFSLNVLFDIRKGGNFISYTKDLTEFNGTAVTTLIGNREAFVVENSVVENADGTFSPNTVETNPYDFLRVQPFSQHLIDASFVKLRELSLGYQLPKSLTEKLGLNSARLSIFGKNLKFWLPEENTFADPELNGAGGAGSNAVGIETTQTPPSKSYGINLGITF